MTDGAGVIRSAEGLRRTLSEIAQIETVRPDCPVLGNMTATAMLIAAAALARRESRGAHFRADFPATGAVGGARSSLTLAQAKAIAASDQLEPT